MFTSVRNKYNLQNSAWRYRAGVRICYQRDRSPWHPCISRGTAEARARLPPAYYCGCQRGDAERCLHRPGSVLAGAGGRPHSRRGARARAVSGACPPGQRDSGSGSSGATAFHAVWSQSHLLWDAWDAAWRSTAFPRLKHNTRCFHLIDMYFAWPKVDVSFQNIYSFHITSHPYRKAHLKGKTRLSTANPYVTFFQVCVNVLRHCY